jgi:L-threonylcarbamoyladenylate synthase
MIKYFDWTEEIVENELDEVVETLNNRGVIVFPTETVYGMGGSALEEDAVDKIYRTKQRPRNKPLSIMLSKKEDIEKYAYIQNDLERKIIDKCLPGPLTIILKKKDNIGKGFTKDVDTIGIRIPENKIAQAILNKVNYPLVAPSANISGEESGIDISKIILEFGSVVDAIIDGGKPEIGLDSTIVQVVDNDIKILRQGRMTKDDILYKISDNQEEIKYEFIMKLDNYTFNKIKSGETKYNFRLYDEKRRSIKLGDIITYRNTDTNEEIQVRVKGLLLYKKFEDLVRDVTYDVDPKMTLQEKVWEIRKYYSEEDEAKYGVVGLRVEIVL